MTEPPGDRLIQPPFALHFLTSDWVWEEDIAAETPARATEMARSALEAVVRDEQPELACVTVVHQGHKLGVWDWIGGQFVWSAEPHD